MKKLILSIFAISSIICAKAQNKPQLDSAFVKVSYIAEKFDKSLRTAEINFRNAAVAEKVAQGYTRLGVFQNPANQKPGRYLVFVKSK